MSISDDCHYLFEEYFDDHEDDEDEWMHFTLAIVIFI